MKDDLDMCELILSQRLADSEMQTALKDVLKIEVHHLHESAESGIYYTIEDTDDSIFPAILDVYGGKKTDRLSEFQGIDLAQRLFEKLKIDSLSYHYDLVSGLPSDDPYWYLLHESGRWYLADTSGSRLEDPRWPSGVRKEKELSFEGLMERDYHWDDSQKKLLCQPGIAHNGGKRSPLS